MRSKLPRSLSYTKVIKALNRAGFYIRRERKHTTMRRDDPFAQVTIPRHKSIDTGTLDVILEGANLSVPEFLKLLKKKK